jgi:thymidylate kinase
MESLKQRGCIVAMRHLKPRIALPRRKEGVTIVVDPHGKPPRSAITSMVKLFVWLLEEWYATFFLDKNETLLLCDRYYHDLLIDPIRYRYGGPLWIATLVGKLIPQPRLWVLLDAPAEVLQARKQEVTSKESARQRQAYLDFIRSQRHYEIADASQPLKEVIANVERFVAAAVIKAEHGNG